MSEHSMAQFIFDTVFIPSMLPENAFSEFSCK